jgi:hypothetical protein
MAPQLGFVAVALLAMALCHLDPTEAATAVDDLKAAHELQCKPRLAYCAAKMEDCVAVALACVLQRHTRSRRSPDRCRATLATGG